MPIGLGLELQQARPVRPEGRLQPKGHVRRQRRPAVQQIRQRRPAHAQATRRLRDRHARRDDPPPDEAADVRTTALLSRHTGTVAMSWGMREESRGPARFDRRSGEPRLRPSPQGFRGTWEKRDGTPGWIRTSDPRFRRPMLYPPELRAHALESVVYGNVQISASRFCQPKPPRNPLRILVRTRYTGRFSTASTGAAERRCCVAVARRPMGAAVRRVRGASRCQPTAAVSGARRMSRLEHQSTLPSQGSVILQVPDRGGCVAGPAPTTSRTALRSPAAAEPTCTSPSEANDPFTMDRLEPFAAAVETMARTVGPPRAPGRGW